MRRWNDEKLLKQYERIKEYAKGEGFSDEDLERHYLDKLNKSTSSKRIKRLIRLAYYLGWMRGIAYVDEMKTPITLNVVPNAHDDHKEKTGE